jgi:oligoribonuclease (3'-5' exoribonuclease)
MKYLALYENKNLVNNFLQTIHQYIDHETEYKINIIIAGSFRFFLEDNYPNLLDEYLYRISDGENIKETILDISSRIDIETNMLNIINQLI